MDLYDGLLSELECKICMTYMGPPIRQCKTGHSICEPCMKKLSTCPLCKGEFTLARNIALETLARKMMYPCINTKLGCTERYLLVDREKHEASCNFKGHKCAFPRCLWSGAHKDIKNHWLEKKQSTRPYSEHNVCHTKVDRPDKYYVNLCIAYGQLFWVKFKNASGTLYWNVNFIGDEENAKNYYFEVEILKPGDQICKYIMTDYCSSENGSEMETFVTTTSAALNGYYGENQLLIYYLTIKKVPKTKSITGKSVDDLLIHFEETDLNPTENKKGSKDGPKRNFKPNRQKGGNSQHKNKSEANS